jgi:hypothetical protein
MQQALALICRQKLGGEKGLAEVLNRDEKRPTVVYSEEFQVKPDLRNRLQTMVVIWIRLNSKSMPTLLAEVFDPAHHTPFGALKQKSFL